MNSISYIINGKNCAVRPFEGLTENFLNFKDISKTLNIFFYSKNLLQLYWTTKEQDKKTSFWRQSLRFAKKTIFFSSYFYKKKKYGIKKVPNERRQKKLFYEGVKLMVYGFY